MKRKILPLVVAGAAAGFAGVAAADVTVYGKANITLNSYDEEKISGGVAVDSADNWELESNASRIGIKGSYEISESLKAIYKFEYETFIDDGDDGSGHSSEFKQRNIYAGFQGDFGTLIAGKHDTPLKLAQGKVDRFNDLPLGDIKNVMVGENRVDNVIAYTTPKMGGFSATLAVIPGEQDGVSNDSEKDGLADSTSAVLSYKTDDLRVALAFDQDVLNTDTTRLVAEYTVGYVKLGALYQTAERSDDYDKLGNEIYLGKLSGPVKDFDGAGLEEQDAYLLSAEWKFAGDWKLKGQYAHSESELATIGWSDAEVTQMAVGVEKKLNKKSKIFAYYSELEAEGDSLNISADSTTDKTFAIGYEIKF